MLKILTGLILSAICFSSYASVSPSEAMQVYKNIIKKNGLTNYPEKVVFLKRVGANAATTGRVLVITTGLLKMVNKDELAWTLGHELGHKHQFILSSSKSQELGSDEYGMVYSKKAGYDACKGAKIHLKLNDEASETRPSSRERYNRIKCSR